jgi:hypothetical protein
MSELNRKCQWVPLLIIYAILEMLLSWNVIVVICFRLCSYHDLKFEGYKIGMYTHVGIQCQLLSDSIIMWNGLNKSISVYNSVAFCSTSLISECHKFSCLTCNMFIKHFNSLFTSHFMFWLMWSLSSVKIVIWWKLLSFSYHSYIVFVCGPIYVLVYSIAVCCICCAMCYDLKSFIEGRVANKMVETLTFTNFCMYHSAIVI